MEEIRFIAGPIIQRYMDKVENERLSKLQAQQEEAAKRKAAEDSKKAAEGQTPDAEMKDAPAEGEAKSDLD